MLCRSHKQVFVVSGAFTGLTDLSAVDLEFNSALNCSHAPASKSFAAESVLPFTVSEHVASCFNLEVSASGLTPLHTHIDRPTPEHVLAFVMLLLL